MHRALHLPLAHALDAVELDDAADHHLAFRLGTPDLKRHLRFDGVRRRRRLVQRGAEQRRIDARAGGGGGLVLHHRLRLGRHLREDLVDVHLQRGLAPLERLHLRVLVAPRRVPRLLHLLQPRLHLRPQCPRRRRRRLQLEPPLLGLRLDSRPRPRPHPGLLGLRRRQLRLRRRQLRRRLLPRRPFRPQPPPTSPPPPAP